MGIRCRIEVSRVLRWWWISSATLETRRGRRRVVSPSFWSRTPKGAEEQAHTWTLARLAEQESGPSGVSGLVVEGGEDIAEDGYGAKYAYYLDVTRLMDSEGEAFDGPRIPYPDF